MCLAASSLRFGIACGGGLAFGGWSISFWFVRIFGRRWEGLSFYVDWRGWWRFWRLLGNGLGKCAIVLRTVWWVWELYDEYENCMMSLRTVWWVWELYDESDVYFQFILYKWILLIYTFSSNVIISADKETNLPTSYAMEHYRVFRNEQSVVFFYGRCFPREKPCSPRCKVRWR